MTNKTAQQRSRQAGPDAESVLSKIGPIAELIAEVRAYPVQLLRRISDLYATRGAPVPDHALHLTPYLGETALRGLIEGGYVELHDHTHVAVHAYTPTPTGIALVGSRAPAKRAAPKKVKA